MARTKSAGKLGLPYKTWLRRRQGKPEWPEVAEMVIVLWRDAAVDEALEDAACIMSAAGPFIVKANEKEVVIAHQIYADRDSRDHLTVPAGMVERVIPIARAYLFAKPKPQV